jgi:hypothetical protein
MHLHSVTPFGIVCPIETGRLVDVHGCEGMVSGQRVIIERGCVIRKLRPMLLVALTPLGFSALIGGGEVINFFI